MFIEVITTRVGASVIVAVAGMSVVQGAYVLLGEDDARTSTHQSYKIFLAAIRRAIHEPVMILLARARLGLIVYQLGSSFTSLRVENVPNLACFMIKNDLSLRR
jgi:hypothetical protein